jgi:hypothetical protein
MNNINEDPLEVLRNFNKWRRGEEIAQPSQSEIGLAIYAVIDELEMFRRGECCGLRHDAEKTETKS